MGTLSDKRRVGCFGEVRCPVRRQDFPGSGSTETRMDLVWRLSGAGKVTVAAGGAATYLQRRIRLMVGRPT
jgi:hypothetical protein